MTLAIAVSPAFGRRQAGLTWRQKPGGVSAAIPGVLFYAALIVALALLFPNEPPTREDIAFQLTMPGLEEEAFYRGVLLLALDRAFTGRVRLLGVDWGWGAVLSCALFGLTHAFGFAHGAFRFDALTMALTGGPAFVAVWVRYRTGSLVVPVLLHNAGNTVFLFV